MEDTREGCVTRTDKATEIEAGLKIIAGMLLYCHYIIFNDMDKVASLEALKKDIKDDEAAERIAKKFENKIMNYLAKELKGKVKGRKNFAIITSIILDRNASVATMDAMARMIE